MIVLYPGQGLGAIDRPVLIGTLGYQPISPFVWFDVWIQVEGREPDTGLVGLEELLVASGQEALVSIAGREPSMSSMETAPSVLGARDPSPPLAAAEPSVLRPPPFSGGGTRLAAPKHKTQLSGKRSGSLQGTEYDDEIEGKERGWPRN